MIYLSISVSAVGTFGNLGYIYTSASLTETTSRSWQSIELKSNTDQEINLTSGSYTQGYIWNAYKTNQIIQDGYIIVVTIKLYNVQASGIEFLGAGQLGSGTIPTSNTTAAKLNALDLNQEIIASTISEDGAYVRLTATFKASGFVNQYPVCLWKIKKKGNLNAVEYCNAELYETIEEAAGSGVTPEEMREVLSSWSEEELIPGIGQEVGDQIEDKVPAAVEDALNQHDQQKETQAGSKIEEFKEQLQEAIDPYFENTTEIRDALHGGLTGVFGYQGTDATITFPAANNPLADNAQLWPETLVDLGVWWNRLPAAMRSTITIFSTFVILYCCLNEMLDTINTILIHRELLGMPDDAFGFKAKSWSD